MRKAGGASGFSAVALVAEYPEESDHQENGGSKEHAESGAQSRGHTRIGLTSGFVETLAFESPVDKMVFV